jgi:hypothetical protein
MLNFPTPRAGISNAACDVAQHRTRRLHFPRGAFGDFAGQKVCKNTMKSPILLSAVVNLTV